MASHAELIGKAWFRGKLYQVGDYPGAVLSRALEDRIDGEVYRLHDSDMLLPILDRYEECGPDFPKPHEYLRQQHPVCLISSVWIRAWVYVYNRPTAGLECLNRKTLYG